MIEQELIKGWETVTGPESEAACTAVSFDSSDISFEKTEDGNKVTNGNHSYQSISIILQSRCISSQTFKFFYWDAFEDHFTQPGTVYLFGKVAMKSSRTFASCCVTVKNIPRRVFFLPREKVRSVLKFSSCYEKHFPRNSSLCRNTIWCESVKPTKT